MKERENNELREIETKKEKAQAELDASMKKIAQAGGAEALVAQCAGSARLVATSST